MSRIDWPLAIVLAVVFVVMSFARWRYFMRVWKRRGGKNGADERKGG